MSAMLSKLNNMRVLRTMSREFSIDVLEDMLEKVRVVTEEKRAQAQVLHQEQAQKQAKISNWLETMQAEGISVEELLTHAPGVPGGVRKRSPRPAKYRYTDVNGEVKTWTGQGRTPKPIAQALAGGQSLDDFLI